MAGIVPSAKNTYFIVFGCVLFDISIQFTSTFKFNGGKRKGIDRKEFAL